MSEHTKSPHVAMLMGGSKHKSSNPADILMRGHHASGGAAEMHNGGMTNSRGMTVTRAMGGPAPATQMMRRSNNAPTVPQKFKNGGNVRHRHADGGPTSLQGATSMDMPQQPQQPNAMNPQQAQQPAAALKRGGRARRRDHHFLGSLVRMLAPTAIQGLGKMFGFAEGGDVNTKTLKRSMGGEAEKRACGGELKRAMGGSGKIRKGMMSLKGGIL